jgi:hypothetical protein
MGKIPPPPKMTPGGSDVQLHCDLQSWLLWAKTYHPTAPAKIRKEFERRFKLCGLESDDPPELSEKEIKPMATKAKKKPASEPPKDKTAVPPPKNKAAISVYAPKGTDFDLAVNKTFLKPQVTAARNIQSWNNELSVDGIRAALTDQIEKVVGGDMSRPEAMLLTQAHTLDFLFGELAQKANKQQQMPHYEAFMRMALKAQNQCRMTLETLSNIKNPPVIFAKQANFSGGHQQINNGAPGQASHAEEKENLQNKILEHTHGERLDTGEKSETVSVNSRLDALEKEHRPKVDCG